MTAIHITHCADDGTLYIIVRADTETNTGTRQPEIQGLFLVCHLPAYVRAMNTGLSSTVVMPQAKEARANKQVRRRNILDN